MLLRRAAIVDGYRNIAENIKGVNIDSTTTVEQAMVTSDMVTTKVQAFIRGARIVSERAINGGYEVTMTVDMYGTNSLAAAVMPKPTIKEPFPEAGSYKAVTGPAAADPSGRAAFNTTVDGTYTGLIVDCRGYGLKPVMSPVIRMESGQPIYGYKNLDYDKVVHYGMASYSKGDRNLERAGSHPLVVKALYLSDDNASPIISTLDADKILMENKASHFLDNCNVVFVRDI